MRSLWKGLSSLKLTIICLALLMVLIVLCTLAQVELGTFGAVDRYIRTLLVTWSPPGTSWKIPVFPGGALVGLLLLANLLAAHAERLELSLRKTGLWVIHFGLILLFLGEFVTGLFQVEARMALEEGSSSNYTEVFRETELAVIVSSHPDYDEVHSVPESLFSRETFISPPKLPFSLLIKKYYSNSVLQMREGPDLPSLATKGPGSRLKVWKAPPVAADDQENQVSAFVEVMAGDRSLGTWLLSSGLGAPQSFELDRKTYRLAIRPKRDYLPFSIHLKDFKHDRYPGTDIPKNFSSLVHLSHPEKGEDRDVLIYMNHPLRYGGKTFYQASFAKEDTVSIFQVVENPGWLIPYLACSLVGLGLLVHFFMHLRKSLKPSSP